MGGGGKIPSRRRYYSRLREKELVDGKNPCGHPVCSSEPYSTYIRWKLRPRCARVTKINFKLKFMLTNAFNRSIYVIKSMGCN